MNLSTLSIPRKQCATLASSRPVAAINSWSTYLRKKTLLSIHTALANQDKIYFLFFRTLSWFSNCRTSKSQREPSHSKSQRKPPRSSPRFVLVRRGQGSSTVFSSSSVFFQKIDVPLSFLTAAEIDMEDVDRLTLRARGQLLFTTHMGDSVEPPPKHRT